MKKYRLLSIDETRKPSYKHPSKLFIVSGVIIPERFKIKLNTATRKIKKKYFNNPDIVFHTRDMLRAKGEFVSLQDPKVAEAFWTEFLSVIDNPLISLFFIITNKENAKKLGWQSHTILERAYIKNRPWLSAHSPTSLFIQYSIISFLSNFDPISENKAIFMC